MWQSLRQVSNLSKKETLAQVFSYEFFKISKNRFLAEHLRASAPREKEKQMRQTEKVKPVKPLYCSCS